MILALLVCNWHLIQLAAILYFANMAASSGARLGTHQKSKQFVMDDLWAKFGAFGRIWTQKSLTPLTTLKINVLTKEMTYWHGLFVYMKFPPAVSLTMVN